MQPALRSIWFPQELWNALPLTVGCDWNKAGTLGLAMLYVDNRRDR
jgi:hypothetical protein